MTNYIKKLESAIKANWDKPALCNFKGESFTYAELAESIEKFHIFFEAAGIGKGERMAICARNSARWGISFLAASSYGAVAVPILADFHPDSIASLTDHSESTILFTDPEIWAKLDKGVMSGLKCAISVKDHTLLYAADEAVKEAYAATASTFTERYPMGFTRESVCYTESDLQDLAVINYTSGTTSAPKGVMLRYECLSDMLEFSQESLSCTAEDSVVSMLPLAHMYGLACEFIYPCCSGCTIHFLGKTPSPTLLMKAMKEVRPFMVIAVPLVMEKVYKSAIKPTISKWWMKMLLWIPGINRILYNSIGKKVKEAFGGRVRIFIMGGAALNPEVERCFRHIRLPYTVGYGMTEASPLLTYTGWQEYVPGSCGKPVHEIRIDSEDPRHIAGEIQARGHNICSGYYRNPEANAMAFTEDGWLRTGDLGVMDDKGNVYIKGRSKSMILTANGQNVYPEELEAIINSQPYIAESVVLDRASRIVGLLYLDKDAIKRDKLDEETIADIPENARIGANRRLPSYSQIAKVEVMLEPFEKTPKMSIKRFLYK